MTTTDYEKAIIATAAWRDFQNEPASGMIFAAMVLRNRAAKGWFGGSLYLNAVGVLVDKDPYFPDVRAPNFQTFLAALDGVVSGKAEDRTGGALYWAPLADEETISGERTAQIGRFVFFK